jgi:predicted ArsR family transcriptional regulator
MLLHRVTTMTPTPQRTIEDVLCSNTRLKILKVLLDSQLTPTEIARKVGVNFMNTQQHLELLEEEGIVSHVNFGKRIRYYQFNETSQRAKAVRNLMGVFHE